MAKLGPSLPRRLEALRQGLARPRGSPAGPPRTPDLIEKVAARTSAVFSIVTSLALMAVVIGVVGIIVKEFRERKLWLEPIAVPRALAEGGVSPSVVSERIAERIQTIRRDYALASPFPSIAASGTLPELHLLGTGGLSLQALVRNAKEALGRPDMRITGEITTLGDTTVLTVRYPATGLSDRVSLPAGNADVDALVQKGAESVLKLVDPELLSSYLYSRDWSRSGSDLRFRDLEALLDYREANGGERNSPRVLLYRGLVTYFRGDFGRAQSYFERVMALDPSIADTYAFAGWTAIELGSPEQAARMLREARARGAHSAQTLERVAHGWQKMDRQREAYDTFVDLLRLEPSRDRARILLSNTLLFAHRPDEAIALLESFTPRTAADVPDYEASLAWTLARSGRMPGRVTQIREHLEREFPGNFNTQWVQAEEDALIARYDQAEARFQLLASENPGWMEPNVRLAEIALARGDFETARQRFAKCATPLVPNGRCSLGHARALAGQGRNAEAIEQLATLVKRDPDYVEAWDLLAVRLTQTGHRDAAAEAQAQAALARQRLAVPLPRP